MGSLAVGVLLFSTQDAIIKSWSGDYSVIQAIVTRCVVALPILLCFVHFEGALKQIPSRRSAALILRGLIMLVAYTAYYMALPALPLATAVALFFTEPLFITLLAALFLGENVSWRATTAVVIGFTGVLVITAPGFERFEPALLLSLISAFAYATAQVLARKLGVSEPASVMSLYQNGVYLLGGAIIAVLFHGLELTSAPHPSLNFLVRPWVVPNLTDFLLMASCGIIAAFGSTLSTHAYRTTEAHHITVFEYTGLIWAPLRGFLFLPKCQGQRQSWASP